MARMAVRAAVLVMCALVTFVSGCSTGERVDLGEGAGGSLVAAIAGEPDQLLSLIHISEPTRPAA